jgi:hypothetical protein
VIFGEDNSKKTDNRSSKRNGTQFIFFGFGIGGMVFFLISCVALYGGCFGRTMEVGVGPVPVVVVRHYFFDQICDLCPHGLPRARQLGQPSFSWSWLGVLLSCAFCQRVHQTFFQAQKVKIEQSTTQCQQHF